VEHWVKFDCTFFVRSKLVDAKCRKSTVVNYQENVIYLIVKRWALA
jgi:hypothetical protein